MSDWTIGTTIGRWLGLGPYYAMFPVQFAREMVEKYSAPNDLVMDPFCGRGTTNYVSQVLERNSYGFEINPVGWLYAQAKTNPAENSDQLVERIREVAEMRLPDDYEPENEFQDWAWCRNALSFIKSARRNLNWKSSPVDKTIAALLLVYLHAKIGGGLSNQMRQSKSLAPDYSVRWWKKRNMRPPEIDPVDYLIGRVKWRYSKGIPHNSAKSTILLRDARDGLASYNGPPVSLVLTSPPYLGVTNYEYDNWIRNWALGGPCLPSGNQDQRFHNREKFSGLIESVYLSLSNITDEKATIVTRTDYREFTLKTTAYAIYNNWPNHRVFARHSRADKPTQTALFGDKSLKPGEVDIIALPNGRDAPVGFVDLETGLDVT